MKSITEKYWEKPLPFLPTAEEKARAQEFNVYPEIIKILADRGIKGSRAIRQFLYPTLQDIADPATLKGIDKAAELVHEAIITGEDIIVWGDYDVDGVTATSLLVRFLTYFTQNISWFVPNRFIHGYGLHKEKLEELIHNCHSPSPLLVTVDCGMTNHEEVAYAKAAGCRIIVTDHHEPGEHEVQADAIINPRQNDCSFENDDLAGVGLAFYLAVRIRAFLKEQKFFTGMAEAPNLKQFLDIVAIGTIADMVPLRRINRVLVKAGFEVLNSTPLPGVAALLESSDIQSGNITSEDIAFQIAPKINAAGRLAEASLAVELLLEDDQETCRKLARKLTRLNDSRKKECRKCLESTLTLIVDKPLNGAICFVEKIDYSIGILGIVASQVVEKQKVPVILVAEVEDMHHGKVLKGSCRSVSGVNIHAALQKCGAYLLQAGGHAMAAGITLLPENFEKFKQKIYEVIATIQTDDVRPKTVDIEMTVEKALSPEIIQQLHLLEPFGVDNEKPIFYDKDVITQDIRRIGKDGDHLCFYKRGKFSRSKCIAFRFGDHDRLLRQRKTWDLLYTIAISRFKKAEKWQANLVDIIE